MSETTFVILKDYDVGLGIKIPKGIHVYKRYLRLSFLAGQICSMICTVEDIGSTEITNSDDSISFVDVIITNSWTVNYTPEVYNSNLALDANIVTGLATGDLRNDLGDKLAWDVFWRAMNLGDATNAHPMMKLYYPKYLKFLMTCLQNTRVTHAKTK